MTSAGNVGIGTSIPKSKLEVLGRTGADTISVQKGYIKLPTADLPAGPPTTDCDQAAEVGRMVVQSRGAGIWVCFATGGTSDNWATVALNI